MLEGYIVQCISELFEHKVDVPRIKENVDNWKKKGSTMEDSIEKGMRLILETLFKRREVLLGPKVLVIACSKI